MKMWNIHLRKFHIKTIHTGGDANLWQLQHLFELKVRIDLHQLILQKKVWIQSHLVVVILSTFSSINKRRGFFWEHPVLQGRERDDFHCLVQELNLYYSWYWAYYGMSVGHSVALLGIQVDCKWSEEAKDPAYHPSWPRTVSGILSEIGQVVV